MAKHPVVVYGASGYTGMLTMDWLIDQDIPFTAVARNAKRTEEMMRQRVVRLESARYEIVECAHDVASLTQAFRGAGYGLFWTAGVIEAQRLAPRGMNATAQSLFGTALSSAPTLAARAAMEASRRRARRIMRVPIQKR